MTKSMTHQTRALAQADLVLLVSRFASGLESALGVDVTPDELEELLDVCGVTDLEARQDWFALVAEFKQCDPSELGAEYTRLFQGAVACPINETAYIRRDKGTVIADLCGFYRAFGIEPHSVTGEKADHLAAELEFWGVLLVMHSRAESEGRTEDAEVTRAAMVSLLEDHVADWYPLFCERLHETAQLIVFHRMARCLTHLWDTVAVFHGLPSFSETLATSARPLATEDDGSPYECDMADADAAAAKGCAGCSIDTTDADG